MAKIVLTADVPERCMTRVGHRPYLGLSAQAEPDCRFADFGGGDYCLCKAFGVTIPVIGGNGEFVAKPVNQCIFGRVGPTTWL